MRRFIGECLFLSFGFLTGDGLDVEVVFAMRGICADDCVVGTIRGATRMSLLICALGALMQR